MKPITFTVLVIIVELLLGCSSSIYRINATEQLRDSESEKLASFSVPLKKINTLQIDGNSVDDYENHCCSLFGDNRIYITPGLHTLGANLTILYDTAGTRRRITMTKCDFYFTLGHNGNFEDIFNHCIDKDKAEHPEYYRSP